MDIYFDGSCKPNPGKMGCGIVICHPDRQPEIIVIDDLGQGTNNIAEWSALILAIDLVRDRGYQNVCIKGDSNMVVQQALGNWKVNGEVFTQLRQAYNELAKGLQFSLCHVPRDLNLAGIYLEKGRL